MPTLRSQAHCLVAQADTHPKPAKELAYPNTRTDRHCSKNERNFDENNKQRNANKGYMQ